MAAVEARVNEQEREVSVADEGPALRFEMLPGAHGCIRHDDEPIRVGLRAREFGERTAEVRKGSEEPGLPGLSLRASREAVDLDAVRPEGRLDRGHHRTGADRHLVVQTAESLREVDPEAALAARGVPDLARNDRDLHFPVRGFNPSLSTK